MKTKLVFMAAFCAFVLIGTTSAFAAGTPAGTSITIQASMSYKFLSGTDSATTQSNIVTVTVEQVPGVALSPTGTLQYASDSMYVYFAHTVRNTGNGLDSYTITKADSANWTSPTVFYDNNGDGILQGGETTQLDSISGLAADAEYKIILRMFIPNNAPSWILDTTRLTVTSKFQDTANVVYDTASAWVRDSIMTKVGNVSTNKTTGDLTPKPGEVINYTITYSNNGYGYATGAYLVDTLSSDVTYNADANIVSGGGSVQFLTSPNRIEWSGIGTGGTIANGEQGTLTFSVTVNSGVSSGTSISNHAYLIYTDSLNGRTKTPLGGPITSIVSTSSSWDLKVAIIGGSFTTDSATDSVNVTLSKYYKIRLKNTGNSADSANISRTTTVGLTWTLFKDMNNDGAYDGGDTPFDLSNHTGVIATGDSIMFIAVDTIGQSVADRSLDSANYLAVSVVNDARDSGWTVTRVKAPVMVLTKSVQAQNGRTRPGDTLIYTITYTNTGSGTANSIVITDASPTNTSYIADSLKIDNSTNLGTGDGTNFVTLTDAADSDEGTVSSGTITVNVGTVGPRLMNDPSYTGKIRFRVKID
ncbi:MAG: hypothetical protein WCW35_03075 [Bacteroidota bacterium]